MRRIIGLAMGLALAGCAETPAGHVAEGREKPLIVRVVGRHVDVAVRSSARGPEYTVVRAGKVVISGATREELAAQAPKVEEEIRNYRALTGQWWAGM